MLIVEDDPRVRSALSELLTASGGFCVGGVAATARDALNTRDGFDVALVDVLLPDLEDGLSVIRALAAEGHPVAALSASTVTRAASMAAGATTFVEKDIHPDALLAALHRSTPGTREAPGPLCQSVVG
ncbi:MAG: response regulator [Solirubrobacteraceae bacterium]